MNIHELDSYDLGDAVKFNDKLNPRIWGADEKMRPEVREQLLRIADDFREFLGIDVEVQDITVSGSNAAFTYTPHSDIDLHLVVDLPEADRNEVYRELFDAKKYAYNDQHDIRIGDYDVELYVQDANKTHHSQGIYSIKNNDWVSVPKKRRPDVDDISVKSKFEDLGHRIESVIKSRDYEQISALIQKIKEYRQAGLDAHGEFGPENLAFKILRTQGLIKKLYDARNEAKDRMLSLDERKKKRKKKVRYGYGGYWYPGTAYAGQDHPAGSEGGDGGGDGGGESIREDAGMTWDGVNPTTCMFLNEQDPESDEDILKDFIDFCVKELKIEHMPRVRLRRDPQWPAVHKTFGRYNDESKTLEVAWGQRHIMDVLRTVAHELTHKHQHEREGERMGPDAGETGSPYENEANARAGVLMRDYGRLHPEYFTAGQAHDLEESASGYIPTKAQAKDPRFSMALTVDIKPGQVGKEANKLKLKTDRQGHPQIARANGLFENLYKEYAEFKKKAKEDYSPDEPPGPESKPTMPAGTLRVDVSDVYDWYKLGQHISNLKGLGKHDFGAGPPSAIVSFGDEDTEHKFIDQIKATGLDVTDIDPADPKKRPGKAIKTDPTYNVDEAIQTPVSKQNKAAEDYYKFILGKAKLGRPLTRAEQDYVKMYQVYRQQKLAEFAPSPERDNNDDVPDQLLVLANRWWNATDKQPQIEHVLNSLGWSIHQVESEDDAVQLQHRDGTTYFISADDFDPDLFEISDELRRSYLGRAGQQVDRRQERMARVRDRLNKGYEIYHAEDPTFTVHRFEANTPAEARRYYETFIDRYESDRDFDLQLRRATGLEENLNELALRSTLPVTQTMDHPGKQVYDMKTQSGEYRIVFGIFNKDDNLDDDPDYDGPTGYILDVLLLGKGPDGSWTQYNTNVGEKQVAQIFATIAQLAVKTIKAHPEIDEIEIKGADPQRSRIYSRLMQQNIDSMLPGWKLGGAGLVREKPQQAVTEVIKMPPVNMVFSNENLVDWAYNDAQKKQARQLQSLKTDVPTRVYDMGDHLRVFVIDDQGPVLYLALEKFLDGFKTNAVQIHPRGQGKNLAFKVYQAVSDTFQRPLYSDQTHTDASRLGIWKKLIDKFPNRLVGYDQATREDLPLTATDQGPVVRGKEPIYVQKKKKDLAKPVTPQTRSRTRLLKFLPATAKQAVTEDAGGYPDVLYHGSTQEIKGPLTPRQAHDIGGAAGSNKNAIYATDDPNFAIAYSLAQRGSDTGTLGWKKDPRLIFFGGKIRHGQNVYLHVLPTRDAQGRPLFTRGDADAEWYSVPGVEEIMPIKVIAKPVDQYLHLLRKPTPEEQKIFQANKARDQQGVAEGSGFDQEAGLSQNQGQVRQTLNAWMNQDQQFKDPTQRKGFQAKVWPYIQQNIKTILADKGEKGNGDYPAAPYAAWLLVQHMDAYPQNQIEFYNALKQAIPDHPKIQFLRDRAAVNQWIMKNANNPEYFIKGKALPNPTVNVRNPAMFKDAGIVATSREEALANAEQAGNKLLVAAVAATNAQTQPSYKQGVNEDEDLDEVKMSPGSLEKFATSPEARGIRAGFEAELIFRDTQGESDEMDPEPDYDADERAYSIQQVIEFFENDEYGYGLSDRERNRLEENLDETYMTWRDEKITSDFRDEAEDLIRERLLEETPMSERIHMYLTDSEQMSDKEADKIIAAGADAPKFTKSSDQEAYAAENPYYQAYLDAADAAEMELDESVEYSVSQQDGYWDEALDDFRDNWNGDDDSFFSDVGLRWMSDIANEYGLDWPVWNMDARGNSGSRDWETIGALLQDAVDMPVKVSSNYHSAARREGQWIIEPDGSLSPDDPDDEAGLEIVSPPMPLLTAIEKLRAVTDWANNPKTGNAYTNSSTGLHMGVSLPSMKSEAVPDDIGIDYVKLILFLGDKYVQQQFGREANTYCASALDKLRQNIKGKRSDPAGVVDILRHGLTELAHRELQKGVGTSKYTSAHIQPGYIEFRSPGGDWLAKADEEIGVLENTMLRFARAMAIAGDPNAERQEYAKKLYKLVTEDNPEYADQLRLFSEFSAGTINKEQLKKQWAETVLQKEVPGAGKEEYEVYGRNNKDNPNGVVASFYARDYDDAYDQFLRKYGANINDLDVRIKQPWFDVFNDKGQVVKTLRAKDIDKATERAQYDFGQQWTDAWKIYRRPDDTPEPKAIPSPRAQVAKRIAQPKPKAVGDDDASDWEAVYKPTGRVFDTLAHADTAQAKTWLQSVMRNHQFTNVDDILLRRVGHKQAVDARTDSADLQRNLGVRDIETDVAQNFAPDYSAYERNSDRIDAIRARAQQPRQNYELVSDEDPDRVIHRMNDATADEVRAWIAQQEQGGMPPGFLRTRIVAEAIDPVSGAGAVPPRNDTKGIGKKSVTPVEKVYKQPVKGTTYRSAIGQAISQQDLENMTSQIQVARKLGDDVNENFADGKVKGKSRPGRVKRAGASCAGSVTDLRARAKKYGGEKGKMYHWCANMKSGRKK